MAQLDILDIFEDCINRLSTGQTIHDCLQAYPYYASRLRPMLETTQTVQTADLVSEVEQREDIPIIWEIIQQKREHVTPFAVVPRRSRNIRTQLLVAIILLLLLTITSWFFLSRPDLPNITVPIVDTLTLVPTQTNTVEPLIIDDVLMTETVVDITPSPTYTKTSTVTITLSSTATMTATISPTYTLTATQTVTPSPTYTLIPSQTPLPTATFVPGCGAPISVTEASELVLEIYPNTTIISARQVTRFSGRLVWEIITSHGIEVTIDVGCGHILTIERDDDGESNTGSTNSPSNPNEEGTSNTNINDSSSSSNINDNSNANSDSSSDFNTNSDTNDNSDDGNDNNDNSNDNDDNSGMGSDDDDDNSGMGSG
jgi:hypothetical protein